MRAIHSTSAGSIKTPPASKNNSKEQSIKMVINSSQVRRWVSSCSGSDSRAAGRPFSRSFGLSGDRLSLRPQVGAGVCELVLSGLIIIWRAVQRHLDICFELSQPEKTPPPPTPRVVGRRCHYQECQQRRWVIINNMRWLVRAEQSATL